MAEELSIISSNLLTNVSESEVNELINQMVEKSKNNMEEICELTLECTTLLSSAESRSTALSNQGVFNRLIGNITGKIKSYRMPFCRIILMLYMRLKVLLTGLCSNVQAIGNCC